MPDDDMLQFDEMASMRAQLVGLQRQLGKLRHTHEKDADERYRRLRQLGGRADQSAAALSDFAETSGVPRNQLLDEASAIIADPHAGVALTFDEADLQNLLEEVADAGGRKDPS